MVASTSDPLFEEIPGDGTEILFRSPSRRQRYTFAEILLLATVLLLLWPTIIPKHLLHVTTTPQWTVYWLVSVPCAIVLGVSGLLALRSIWRRQLLRVDSQRRILGIEARTPWTSSTQAIPFGDILVVEIELDTAQDALGSWVLLRLGNDTETNLGFTSTDGEARKFAGRLATLIGAPVREVKL